MSLTTRGAGRSNLLIVVPARGGSKRIPRKNSRSLAGRPLIALTLDYLEAEGYRENAIVSTDDEEIARIARTNGFNAPFLRPPELATDQAATIDVVMHALSWHQSAVGQLPSILALLQPTSPFRPRGLLQQSLDKLASQPDRNSIIAMRRLHVPATYIFARQEAMTPLADQAVTTFVPTGSLYVARVAAIIGQRTLYAKPIEMIEVAGYDAIDLDDEDDWLLAELIACRGIEVK